MPRYKNLPKKDHRTHDFCAKVFGPSGGRIVETFRLMELAEEEITAAKRRRPEKKQEVHDSFGILFPTHPIRGKSDEVYRAHCRELLDRAAADGDVSDPTCAEILCVVLEASLIAPLGPTALAIAERLFAAVYSEIPPTLRSIVEEPTRESWSGAIDEELDRLRRRLRVEDRKKKA